MTEQDIIQLGYELIKCYTQNQYNTNRFKKGCLQIEFTYQQEELVTVDLCISELNGLQIPFSKIKLLTEAIGDLKDYDHDYEDKEDFQSCCECDLPDACADFGCAINQGINKLAW